jgi:trimethylamine--corrinoid protein Co-methyltransferase
MDRAQILGILSAYELGHVEQVGPGGAFIDASHTAAHFRNELWFPRLLDREFYQAWQDAGAASTEDRCRTRKEEILARHVPEPVPPELDRALDEIVAAARRELEAPGGAILKC